MKALERISERAFKATAFDGSSDIIPSSQVFGDDLSVSSSDAYWISAWILSKKSIQYSRKKQAWFDEFGKQLPTYTVQKHVPCKIKPIHDNEITELKK